MPSSCQRDAFLTFFSLHLQDFLVTQQEMARKVKIPEFYPELPFIKEGDTVEVTAPCSAFGKVAQVISVYYPTSRRGKTREAAAAIRLDSGLETCVWVSDVRVA